MALTELEKLQRRAQRAEKELQEVSRKAQLWCDRCLDAGAKAKALFRRQKRLERRLQHAIAALEGFMRQRREQAKARRAQRSSGSDNGAAASGGRSADDAGGKPPAPPTGASSLPAAEGGE